MGKRELKKQYKEFEFNMVDYLSAIDKTETKKLTPFLAKEFKKWIDYRENDMKKVREGSDLGEFYSTVGTPINELDEIIKTLVFKWVKPKLEVLSDFTEHMEANRLDDNDINNYNSWESLALAVNEAELKQGVKTKRNRIEVLHKDEEWMVLKPLSIEASVNYGYGTKWCTAMKDSSSYFHRYSREGVLLYVINRKEGIKYGFYSSPKEYSVWTAEDARVDSMETRVPFELLTKIRDWCNYEVVGPNYNYFLEEDKHNEGEKLRAVLQGGLLNADAAFEADMSDEDEAPRMTFQAGVEYEAEEEGFDFDNAEPANEETAEMMELVAGEASPEAFEAHGFHMENPTPINPLLTEEVEGPVHGRMSENGERTWNDPYPNGMPAPLNGEPMTVGAVGFANAVAETAMEETMDVQGDYDEGMAQDAG